MVCSIWGGAEEYGNGGWLSCSRCKLEWEQRDVRPRLCSGEGEESGGARVRALSKGGDERGLGQRRL